MSDTISRQAAIEALADMHCKSDEDGYVWIIRSDAWARIDALPSAQPEHMSWTLCRHQMPENNVNVLFCSVDGEIFVGHHFHLDNYWVTMGYAIPDNNVKAWMPLPEPHKGGEQDAEV